ncbi:helix-turn-helix transcriptional regulator [Candidatus Palauibacter sp.]|uniref:helix-turn-helix transcriptional regulator n=1 Tax=Candidatus Palauibacter sp. TaxID=3101350 RepID=UPI003CC51F54
MTEQDRFERTLASLYRAALADANWVSAAALVNDTIRTGGHGLSYGDPCGGVEPKVFLHRLFVGRERREDLEQLYLRDYFRRDEVILRLFGLRDGEVAYKSDLYTDQEKKTSTVYNEFRRVNQSQKGLFMVFDEPDGRAIVWSVGNSAERGGWGHDQIETVKRLAPHIRQFVRVRHAMANAGALGASLAELLEDGRAIVWSVGNSAERGGWGHDQIETVKRLAPHIRQFVRVRHAMANAGALGASLAELLEDGRSGFIQLDRRGRILEANDRARDILLKRDGLCDAEGVLTAGIPEEDAELQRVLARALPPYGVQGAGGSMKITRTKARTPLVLEVHPVQGMGADHRAWEVGALVLVVDPEARPRVDPDLAAAVLGLTPTESRVAVELATGQTVAGIAHELGCAESTVCTHLKRVYRKQGISKQTELVRRVLSLEALRGPQKGG